MDHFPKLAHDHASLDFEGVSIYEGEIPHDVDHHGMTFIKFREYNSSKGPLRDNMMSFKTS